MGQMSLELLPACAVCRSVGLSAETVCNACQQRGPLSLKPGSWSSSSAAGIPEGEMRRGACPWRTRSPVFHN